jgi:tetratricopeptide (TPR) repeat protein
LAAGAPADVQALQALAERFATVRTAEQAGSSPGFVAAGRSALALKKPAEAADLARGAILLDAASAPAWTLLGDALRAQGALETARDAYEAALAIDSDVAVALACADVDARLGLVEEAVALLHFVLLRAQSATLRADAEALLLTLDPTSSGGDTP